MASTNPIYRYRLVSTGASSHKYGPCEVCGEHASEVFSQVEERKYDLPGEIADCIEDPANYKGGIPGWTRNDCFSYFGHSACLLSKRRGETEATTLNFLAPH